MRRMAKLGFERRPDLPVALKDYNGDSTRTALTSLCPGALRR